MHSIIGMLNVLALLELTVEQRLLTDEIHSPSFEPMKELIKTLSIQ
jgi:hypothetical protein